MKIVAISEEEFNNYNLDRHKGLRPFFEEHYWFKTNNENLLGTVVFDKSDRDWAYMILAKESDDIYRAFEFKVSLLEEEAKLLLKINMEALSSVDKIEQKLYENDCSPISEPNKLIIADINDELKKFFKKNPEKLYDLDPRKFEELIASILQDLGFDIELTKATRDGGRDIIASIRTKLTTFLTYVECKRYGPEKKISAGLVREVIGVHSIHKPAKSIIVTTSFFTKDAIKEAKTFENQLSLKDYNDIKQWLQNY